MSEEEQQTGEIYVGAALYSADVRPLRVGFEDDFAERLEQRDENAWAIFLAAVQIYVEDERDGRTAD